MRMISDSLSKDLKYTFDKLSGEEKIKLQDAVMLITGCAGSLGYYFMHFLDRYAGELGIKKVIALDNFILGKPAWIEKFSENGHFSVNIFDTVRDDLRSVFMSDEADHIIHMASIASPVFYRNFPIETLDANVWGLRHLLDHYKDREIKGFLFFSSSEIYGDPAPEYIPTDENYPGFVSATGPRACYDESKRIGETMCMLYGRKYQMPIGVARPFNNYGPGSHLNDKRVTADFVKAIEEEKDIEILSDGSPTRTFCYVADAVAGYLKILLHGSYDYFNIGIEGPEITVGQLAQIYVKKGQDIFGYRSKVTFGTSKDKDYLTDNPQRRCPSIAKARKLLGYAPEIEIEEGVERYLRFIAESPESEYKW